MRPSVLLLLLLPSCGRTDGHPKGWSYDGVWGHGMWVSGIAGRERLKAVVYFPMTKGNLSVHSSMWRGEAPAPQGVSMMPEGVFLDGKAVAVDETSPVLVWTRNGKLVPLKLPPDGVATIEAEADTDTFHASLLWKDTLRPLILKAFED